MSQRNVERVIGRLVTDEGFRRRFAADPRAAVGELIEGGVQLNSCEVRGLTALDPGRLARFAEAIHPCIQKVELTAPDGRLAVDPEDRLAVDVENRPLDSTYERSAGGDAEPASEPNAELLGETP